jgi:acetylglutamate kinase
VTASELSLSSVAQRTRAKARVLLDALPYIREHSGSTVVIKVGGAAMEDPSLSVRFAEDVSLLRLVGVRPLVVHGGGPQISELSRPSSLCSSTATGSPTSPPWRSPGWS